MNADLLLIALFGLLTIIIEGLLWGMMGYVLFRSFKMNDKFWWLGAIMSGLFYFLWDEIITGQIIGQLGLKVNNESVAELLGDEMFTIDFTDLIFSIVSLLLGFRISMAILKKLIQMESSVEPVLKEE
jgi:hypothetical protein